MTTATRELANRLRATLAWIDDNADTLPGGWRFSGSGSGALHWSVTEADTPAVVDALTHMLGEPILDEGQTHRWADWPREGDRPTLTVFLGLVQP